jgi:hypothetical protein
MRLPKDLERQMQIPRLGARATSFRVARGVSATKCGESRFLGSEGQPGSNEPCPRHPSSLAEAPVPLCVATVLPQAAHRLSVIPRAADHEGWCKHRNTDHDEPFGADIVAGGHWPSSARDSVSTGKHDFGRRGTGRFLRHESADFERLQMSPSISDMGSPSPGGRSVGMTSQELLLRGIAAH